MGPTAFTIRRATLDDLDTLRGLWRESRLPEYDLDKRFTEFQVAVDSQDWILAAVGIRFASSHGEIHSFSVRRSDQRAELREALWARILQLAEKQGTHRLWARPGDASWDDKGFALAAPAVLKELPPPLGGRSEGWHTLKLRDEPLKLIAADEQLEAFLELERSKTDQMIARWRVLKLLAVGFIGVLFIAAIGTLLYVIRRQPSTRPRQP
ncbi:MAG: hypothetical protein AB7O66_09225 [Limisphaerales bacterium]